MINYQKDIITQFKTAISAVGTFEYVGEFPFDVPKIGNLYPAVLVEDGSETLNELQQNGSVTIDWTVSCWLYEDINQSRVSTILDHQVAIEDAILDNSMLTALGIKANCIELISVEKGENQEGLDKFNVGYNSNMSIRKITFNVNFTTVR